MPHLSGAQGEEEYRQRTAAVQAEADILIAEAHRDARRIRGEGEAEAISIIEEALQRDPEFYRFIRKLESYETSITPGTLLLLSDKPDGYLDMLMSWTSKIDYLSDYCAPEPEMVREA